MNSFFAPHRAVSTPGDTVSCDNDRDNLARAGQANVSNRAVGIDALARRASECFAGARLAPRFDLLVPIATGPKPRFVEPHLESSVRQPTMDLFGKSEIGRGVADENVVRGRIIHGQSSGH